MMHSVPQPGLTVLAVAGQLERGVRQRRMAVHEQRVIRQARAGNLRVGTDRRIMRMAAQNNGLRAPRREAKPQRKCQRCQVFVLHVSTAGYRGGDQGDSSPYVGRGLTHSPGATLEIAGLCQH
jgi:hypothetical protein